MTLIVSEKSFLYIGCFSKKKTKKQKEQQTQTNTHSVKNNVDFRGQFRFFLAKKRKEKEIEKIHRTVMINMYIA